MEHDNSKESSVETNLLEKEKDIQEGKMSARSSKHFDKENEVKQNLMSNNDEEEEGDVSGVKYVPANSINGDAKINLENVKAAFAGMGKEELMKFANDPFWVRIRWTFFILFWLLWVGMLAGAIAIVVVAPKCAAPAPLKWWEQGPLYKVDVASFSGNLKGLQAKIDYFKDLGVKGIIVESIIKSDSLTKSAVDFKEVDPLLGTLDTFKNITSKIKDAGMHLVMSLVPNFSSDQHSWFNKSVHSEQPYTDYYVWASSSRVDAEGNKLPPNKWLSLNGNSAWKWNDVRKQYYLHQFDTSQPDLNFANQDVVLEFKDILKFWLEQGASGFLLEKVDYLLEDPDKRDESTDTVGPNSATHDSYNFYTHYRTTNQDGLEGLLSEWKEVVVNKTGETGLFVAERITSLEPFGKNASDLLLNSQLFSELKEDFSAQALLDRVLLQLNHAGNESRPAWQLGGLAARLGPDYVDPLNMVAAMLPGTPVYLAGEELGQEPRSRPLLWDRTNTTAGEEDLSVEAQRAAEGETHWKVFTEMAKLREEQSIMHGDYNMSLVNNTLFTITWLKSSNPGYLLAFNPSNNNVTVDLTTINGLPDELTVQIHSVNFYNNGADRTSQSHAISFPPRGAVVFTFVPKKT
ncbi:amino acid transporter heavy chain SLC3A1 [Bacillus rossius redtenbacheri]|uniref:amino acid transporter heavy chain SLC3A1 n=1 Tax=Bacillus rossius redtenbacheri TaxID=93214 RepID=UPI002FDD0305